MQIPDKVKKTPPIVNQIAGTVYVSGVVASLNSQVPIAYINPPNPAKRSTKNPSASCLIFSILNPFLSGLLSLVVEDL